eukprot:6101938-Prymnesium_polylepis.1
MLNQLCWMSGMAFVYVVAWSRHTRCHSSHRARTRQSCACAMSQPRRSDVNTRSRTRGLDTVGLSSIDCRLSASLVNLQLTVTYENIDCRLTQSTVPTAWETVGTGTFCSLVVHVPLRGILPYVWTPTRLGAKGPVVLMRIARRPRVPWRGGRPSDSR